MKKWILIILGILTIVGAIIGISTIVEKNNDGLKKINPTFKIGTLDANGEWVDGKANLYTDMFECQGLEIELTFEHNIKYEVFYYDKDEKFIEKSEVLTDDYVNEDLTRIFARILITPDWSKIDTNTHEIKWYEVSKYSNQLSFKVNKVQKEPDLSLSLTIKSGVSGVNSITIKFEDGMTWEDWFNSKYYDGSLAKNGEQNFMYSGESNGSRGLYKNGSSVVSTNLIDKSSDAIYDFR